MAVEEERALVGVAGDATPDFLAVDFFCGAGGTTRGLIDANGYVIAGVDKDARCDDTYVRNNVNTKIDGKAPAFLHRDIFPSTAAYPDGEQGRLYKELSELVRAKRSLMRSTGRRSSTARCSATARRSAPISPRTIRPIST